MPPLERLLRLIIETVFIFLGALVLWLGVTGRIFFDRRATSWLAVSIALILWGALAIYKPGKTWAKWEAWTRGLSLVLLGAAMLAISRVTFQLVAPLLDAAGSLLMLRGFVGAILIARSN
jgi:hypothetical protein